MVPCIVQTCLIIGIIRSYDDTLLESQVVAWQLALTLTSDHSRKRI